MHSADKIRKQEVTDLKDAVTEADWNGIRSIATVSIKHNRRKPEWCEEMQRLIDMATWAEKEWNTPHENMGDMSDGVKKWLHEQMVIGQVMKALVNVALLAN